MDPISAQSVLATAGAASGDATYVDDVFSTYVYEGTGSTLSIDNGIDLSGEGGLVWLKKRSATGNNWIFDTERGANSRLLTNTTGAANTGVTGLSFNSNGFTLNTDSSINASGAEHVMWSFRKAPGFLDIVTYTGDSDINRTVSHSLGSVPGMIIVKKTSGSGGWYTWHRSLGGTGKALRIESTAGTDTNSNLFSTLPTATVFSPGDNTHTNQYGQSYVAYLFAHDDQSFGTNSDEAIIKCGSYSSTGFVDLGFEPQWVIIKSTSDTNPYRGDWRMFDNMRGIIEGDDNQLFANESRAEDTGSFATVLKLDPTGFTVESQGDYGTSTIYMAIRRPHKPPSAATEVFMPVKTTTQPFSVGFPTDLGINKPTGTGSVYWVPRLTNGYLASNATNQESDGRTYFKFDLQNNYTLSNFWGSNETINWQFRRAPGFMDVVAYTGTGSARTINHNLGVAPEFMIVKARDVSENWPTYNSTDGATKGMFVNSTNDAFTFNFWNSTAPTATQFSVATDNAVNGSTKTYIAYLFASLAGISKVGTYSGTGNAVNVDCGFTAGARFVMIKRTNGTGGWFVWDTARGIVSGNDPYLLWNSNLYQVTNTDYIDPLNAGFTVTSSAPAALNASGGTYLFLAIA